MAQAQQVPPTDSVPARFPRVGEKPVHEVRTLLVDDYALHREALAHSVAARGAAVPDLAWDHPTLLATTSGPPPDVVLFNVANGVDSALLQLVRDTYPRSSVIVLGVSEDDESTIISCAVAGVTAYLLRTESIDRLVNLIAQVAHGDAACSPRVSAILLRHLSLRSTQRHAHATALTSREIQILEMIAAGLSNRDIADRLTLSLHTVKNHVHSTLGKLGVSSRAEAAAFARSRR